MFAYYPPEIQWWFDAALAAGKPIVAVIGDSNDLDASEAAGLVRAMKVQLMFVYLPVA